LQPSTSLALAAVLALCAAPAVAAPKAERLSFNELFLPTARELAPSPRLKELSGKRVRMVGFMAKMELPPVGGFWLTSSPVVCDEAGGGTADLPANAVFVVIRSRAGQVVPHTAQRLEAVGLLEAGYSEGADGRPSHVRIVLDEPARPKASKSGTAARSSIREPLQTQSQPSKTQPLNR
jgi:hypothetical protein